MKKGKKIKTLAQLAVAAKARQSVIFAGLRIPAAAALNMQAGYIHRQIERGMWVNIPKRPIRPDAPARYGKTQKTPSAPQPVLLLPYYPNL